MLFMDPQVLAAVAAPVLAARAPGRQHPKIISAVAAIKRAAIMVEECGQRVA